MENLIKAVVIDIDGCLTPKKFGQPLDLESLHEIQMIGSRYLRDPAVPMLILNTGRDMNHTELMAKILNAFHYFIVEMGAAMVSIHGAEQRYKLHPSITPESLVTFDALQHEFLKTYPQYQKYLQYGKRYMVTFLFENESPIKTECLGNLKRFIEEKNYHFHLDEGVNFINIIFPNINKGNGLDLLFETNTELNASNIAGIGDSTGDWDFLKHCAFSACPQNGSQILKKNCHLVATNEETKGTLEIINYIITRNRHVLKTLKSRQKKPTVPIRAVITDINGTIDSAIYGKTLEMLYIKKIRSLIEQSKHDHAIPKIILNTGWDLNYTLLYAQLLNDLHYHIIERGAAIVSIEGPFVHENVDPRINDQVLQQIALFQADFIKKYPHFYRSYQVGKKYMLSFQFELGSENKQDCLEKLRQYIQENNMDYEIEEGTNYINVGVKGINKGSGAEMLIATEPDLSFDNVVGIGDSDGDWSYISKCAIKACPSNASRFLREHCDYVASKPETEGVIEILEQIIQWNLELNAGE